MKLKKKILIRKYKYLNNQDDLGGINKKIKKQIKVIIDGEIKSNILKYKFVEEGIYIIYLISDNLLTNIGGMFSNCSFLKELNL